MKLDVFSQSDVIDHMIRSPPPVSWRPIGSSFNFPCIDDNDDHDFHHDTRSTTRTHYTINSTRSSLSELKFG